MAVDSTSSTWSQRFEQGLLLACFEDATIRYFRLLDDGRHLGRAELLRTDILLEGQHPRRRHDFDHACAVLDLFAHGFDAFIWPIRNTAQRRRTQ